MKRLCVKACTLMQKDINDIVIAGVIDKNRIPLAVEISELGDHFKNIETEYSHYLDPYKYTIVRVDGHCFMRFTKKFNKPCDDMVVDAMIYACKNWIKDFNGVCVYTQSDEATLVINRIEEDSESELQFAGRIEKIATLSSSLFSVYFNELLHQMGISTTATFDARVFQVDTADEVYKVIRWRQLDGFRNGVSAIARSLFSTKELHGVSVAEMLKMIDTDTLEKWKGSHLVHGTFVKKARVDKELPDGTKVLRTEINARVIGNSMRIALFNKDDILSRYLGTKVIPEDAGMNVNITVETELDRLLKMDTQPVPLGQTDIASFVQPKEQKTESKSESKSETQTQQLVASTQPIQTQRLVTSTQPTQTQQLVASTQPIQTQQLVTSTQPTQTQRLVTSTQPTQKPSGAVQTEKQQPSQQSRLQQEWFLDH